MGESAAELLRAAGGVVRVNGDPASRRRLHYLAGRGELARPLPGVFVAPTALTHLPTLALAAMRCDPNAVITGRTAAAFTYWPELPASVVEVATNYARRDVPGFRFSQRVVPPELVQTLGGVRLTTPALTALDLCTGPAGAAAIDRALQLRATSVPELRRALSLTPGRPGNGIRRELLRDVKTEGCSPLERTGHRLLRRAGIRNWVANRRYLVLGRSTRPDVRFLRVRLILEFDGFTFHSSREAFDGDRRRQNPFELVGFTVLRYTDALLDDPDEFITQVRHGLRTALPY
jgi:very-short-patch-repair endonuclease